MKAFLQSLAAVMFTVFSMTPAFADGETPTNTVPAATTEAPTAPKLGYWGVTLGDGFQSENTNKRGNGTFLGLKYGEDFGVYDLEVEGFRSYTSGKSTIGNYDAYVLMANGKYKWLNKSEFTPFLKGGVGFGNITGNGVYNDGNHLLLSGGIGTYYTVSDNARLELGYTRYWSPSADVRNNQWGREDFQEDVVTLGINFDLN